MLEAKFDDVNPFLFVNAVSLSPLKISDKP